MSLGLVFVTPTWGCIVADGRANTMRNGKLAISGDGLVKYFFAGGIGLFAAAGIGLTDDHVRQIGSLDCEFDPAARAIRSILSSSLPDASDPEYRAMLNAGFCRPGAVLLGRRGGEVRGEVLLPTAYSHITGDFALHAIGSAEIVADELRELAQRIERGNLGPASISLLLRNLILLASVRDFVRVSPCVIFREVLAAPGLDETQWRDGSSRKVFFLSPRGFTCRALPQNVKNCFRFVDVICLANGFHFGRGVIADGETVERALAVLSGHGVMTLPPHNGRELVSPGVIQGFELVAPEFGVVPGDTARAVIEKVNAVRGFAPLLLQ